VLFDHPCRAGLRVRGHRGLPVGLLFMGTAWSEPKLIEMAYAYEQRTRARRPPHFDTDALIDAGEP